MSRDEGGAADVMEAELRRCGIEYTREGNNLWTTDPQYDERRTTLLLNAHIDTVKPVESWTRNPYSPTLEGDTLYGLGSNDCGGGLTALLQVIAILLGLALAVTPAFKMKFWNCGAEGQALMGGLAGAIMMYNLGSSMPTAAADTPRATRA